MIESIYVGEALRWEKARLWEKLFNYLSSHEEFRLDQRCIKFPYDWRESLLTTATLLGNTLNAHVSRLAKTDNVDPSLYQFVLLTHSMGSLVARIAIALNAILPDQIDRIIHIGAPLQGAPSAFGSAYGEDILPMLHDLTKFVHGKNAAAFFRFLRENIQTFPSIYQLMPPRSSAYLYYSQNNRVNPLNEGCIPPEYRNYASDAHDKLVEAERIITNNALKVFTIYTETHSEQKTHTEYRVEGLGPSRGYNIIEILGRTNYGDGTVQEESAKGSKASCKANPVLNVTHTYMCNESKVVDLLPGLMG